MIFAFGAGERAVCGKYQKPIWKNFGFVNIYFEFSVDNSENLRIILTCMDMKKECMIPESGPWPDFTGKKILVGSKQLRKALKNDRVAAVFLAENADPRLTDEICKCCGEAGIQPIWVPSMRELGRACGIDVGAAAAAVLK